MILLGAAAFAAVPCRADIIPNAVFSGQVSCGSGPSATQQTDSSGTFSTGCATATLSYLNGTASIMASGYNTNDTYNSVVSTEVSFFFEAVGSKSEPVPVDISGNGSASSTCVNVNECGIYGTASLDTPFGDATACSSNLVAGDGGCSVGTPTNIEKNPFSLTLSGDITPGTIYEVDVTAGGTSASFAGSSFTASMDPQVVIAPSFADANDFTLEFSPNPPSTVPEPSSISLLLVVFLGLGAVLRFRSAKAGRVS
jgi:hypothetical protein